MINIVVFSHSCLRRINRLVYEDIARLSSFKIHIIAPKYLISGSKKIIADKVETQDLCKLHLLNLKGNGPRDYWFEGTAELLSELNPDIIHVDNDPLSYQVRKLSSWTVNKKTKISALTCENLSYYPIDNFKRLGLKGCIRSILKLGLIQSVKHKIDHLFTINRKGEALFLGYGFKSVNIIPLGFSSDIFFVDDVARKSKREELELTNKLVFAYVGRFVKEKGIHILLEALSQQDKSKEWVLLLDEFKDAENTYEKQIRDLILQLNIQDKIQYFDANHFEVAKYMNAADVVVMPSLSTPKWIEQYGRVAPEAMACGKLVIASKSGALIDLVGNSGILFEEGNVNELAHIFSEIISEELNYADYREVAVKKAMTLNTNAQAEQMLQVFQKLLK
jgi:glycosyltransferase involved in cell wall biosynthesis